MTEADYFTIADAFRTVVDALERANPCFDREKFLLYITRMEVMRDGRVNRKGT
jgi:hypothetical protein